MVRIEVARYSCTICGELLDIPLTATPRSMVMSSAGRASVRVLLVNNVEVHRCEMPKVG